MVFQGEYDLFHCDVPLEEPPTRIEQHAARHETQDKMPLVGVFATSLTRLSGQQGLEDAAQLCNPVALIPGWNQPGDLERAGHRDEIQRLLTGLVHHDAQDLTRGSPPSAQPPIATARCLKTLRPGPMVDFHSVRAFDLASVLQGKGIGAFALHQQGPLRRLRDVAPELRVAAPPLGPAPRGGERDAVFGQSRQACIEPVLGQVELVVAAPPRACGLGPTDGTVERDEELAIANDDQEEDPIDAGHGAFARPAGPRADAPEWCTVGAANGSIDEPAPWPATGGGGALLLGVAPHGEEPRKAQAAPACKPGACGQSAPQPGRDMFVPSASARECMAMSASKERGKHEADACAQPLRLGLPAACTLGYQRLGNLQVFEGRMDGLERVLGLGALVLEALLGFESTAFAGFGLCGGVSFHGGHGELRRTVWGIVLKSKETMSHLRRIELTV